MFIRKTLAIAALPLALAIAPAARAETAAGDAWLKPAGLPVRGIRMLNNGRDLTQARLELIESARHSIYLATYHISNDKESTLVFDALCARAKEGLEVRLMIERQGSRKLEGTVDRLRGCGAYVIYHAPLLASRVYVLHEKLLIADGERMIIGGSGYQGWYAHANRFGHYDMDFVVEGAAACRMHRLYADFFRRRVKLDHGLFSRWFGKKRYGLGRFRSCDEEALARETAAQGDHSLALPIWGDPYASRERPILEAHLHAVRSAIRSEEKRIRLYSPYFVPHPRVMAALLDALDKGVSVDVITNSVRTNDERLRVPILIAMRNAVRNFVGKGGRIHLWSNPGTMHRKGGTFGETLAYFGSDNYDNRGQEYSSESVIYSNDPETYASIAREFDEDLRYTTPFTREYLREYERQASDLDAFLSRIIRDHI